MRTALKLPYMILATGLAAISLQGCQLEIKVPNGGRVVTEDGSFACEANQTCTIDVVDLFFNQTFIAEPEPGYSFTGWRRRDGYFCGGLTEPCSLATAGFEDNDAGQAVLESDQTFFLQPRFSVRLEYCPETGLVVSPGPQAHGH